MLSQSHLNAKNKTIRQFVGDFSKYFNGIHTISAPSSRVNGALDMLFVTFVQEYVVCHVCTRIWLVLGGFGLCLHSQIQSMFGDASCDLKYILTNSNQINTN